MQHPSNIFFRARDETFDSIATYFGKNFYCVGFDFYWFFYGFNDSQG